MFLYWALILVVTMEARIPTTTKVDADSWKLLHTLKKETGISKIRLVRLALQHLADCEEAKKGLAFLGVDAEAIADIVRASFNEALSITV